MCPPNPYHRDHTKKTTRTNHILSHGSSGRIQLGTAGLDNNSFKQYQNDLEKIGNSLTVDGDILVYGCDVANGEVGQEFIGKLAQVTSADIAASDDLTGAADKGGGDWVLEQSAGQIGTYELAANGFDGKLSMGFTTASSPIPDSGGSTGSWGVWLAGDFNNDGAVDAVTQFGGAGTAVTLWLNDGSGSYTTSSTAIAATAGFNLLNAKIADFDNDGDLDMACMVSGASNDLLATNVDAPPTLNSFTPTSNATGVGASDNIVLNFTHTNALSKGTGTITIKVDNGDSDYSNDTVFETFSVTDSRVSISGNSTSSTVTINPDGTFAANTNYYLVISPAAFVDADGKGFVTKIENRFHAGVPNPAVKQAGNSLSTVSDKTILSFTTDAVADTTPPVAPTVGTANSTTSVSVTAEAGSTVELFKWVDANNDSTVDSGEVTSLGTATATGGTASFTSLTLTHGDKLVAKATDAASNTSTYSSAQTVSISSPTPTPTPTPEPTPTPVPTPVPTPEPTPTPVPTPMPTPEPTPTPVPVPVPTPEPTPTPVPTPEPTPTPVPTPEPTPTPVPTPVPTPTPTGTFDGVTVSETVQSDGTKVVTIPVVTEDRQDDP
ncbi:DUF4347 domain-containing protein, partial [Aquaspirillum serpens]|uniref:DUF4347 domain-containing protein n=1 Tax=Aquaspirillum serpens TaxID=190 RepID=UPI0003B44888